MCIRDRYDVTVSRPNAHTAYGAIVEGYAVCDGYANAYNDLLGRVGVTATYVLGRKPVHLGEMCIRDRCIYIVIIIRIYHS